MTKPAPEAEPAYVTEIWCPPADDGVHHLFRRCRSLSHSLSRKRRPGDRTGSGPTPPSPRRSRTCAASWRRSGAQWDAKLKTEGIGAP